ncbi:hypothetical protein TBR22_A26800 [Luteitalea sp. TBR-22]|uniref:winged helix-turn-helix domain-containing protein n=1 Tax=Luteitalea sp. TBR-22 TaxID=2802971 RepID=UPI001AFA917A|nr:winged helix-turn-helix domain-containing protein [Luteitalea sp. TBR-22]BCS33453.1 hypothetical protein TBR22_A26800 [Luteitalea sp. TBR-22]
MNGVIYRFGEVEVDVQGRDVRLAGQRVAIEPKALDVLLLLLAEAGRVVDKRRLLSEVWADVHVTDGSLARAVTQVRRALGDDIRAPRFIETVPTRGYRFIGQLSSRPAPEPPPGAVDGAAADPPRTTDRPATSAASAVGSAVGAWRRRAWLGAVATLVLVVAIATALALRRPAAPLVAGAEDMGGLLLGAAEHAAVQLTTSRGFDADPALSPDGAQVAYSSDASGALEIMVRSRVSPGLARALTSNGGDNVDPAWSADGQWVAYHSRKYGGIWIVPAGGGPARQVAAEGSSPSWSPDGRRLVYQTAGSADVLGGTGGSPSTLAIVDLADGRVHALTRPGTPQGFHGNPVWMPGHDTIVFVSVQVPAADVWEVTPGRAPVRLGPCHATCRPFAFRKGGTTWVGAVRGAKAGELWTAPVSADGHVEVSRARRTAMPRTASITDIAVSRDGSTLAFSNAERTSEAWSLELPGGAARAGLTPRVLLAERRPRYSELSFSPDGSRLAYTTSRLGDRPEPWIHDLSTGQSHPLPSPVAGFVRGWLPDGRHVVMVDPAAPFGLQSVDVTTGLAKPLATFEAWRREPDAARRLFTMRLTPDGRRFLFTTEAAGRAGLWLGALDRVGEATPLAADASFGAWSSDGTRVTVQRMRGWRSGVGIMRPGDAAMTALVEDADLAWPNDWSPDDRFIVYAAMRGGRWTLEAVEVGSRRVTTLTSPGGPTEYVRWPVWSPRGDRVVYERGYWTGNVWVASLSAATEATGHPGT